MLHPIDYLTHYRRAPKSARPLLARIALNAVYDPTLFPVDLSEFYTLRGIDRAAAVGLMLWAATTPAEQRRWTAFEVSEFFDDVPPLPGRVAARIRRELRQSSWADPLSG